ncbi:phosphonate C-P lyase system protein PhnH [Waterburya agarophytonicola K14]|uniref:Phosphonate C-P lyase system protein PhnH n=1 Tax=Waterburya agarophytonicola KI4 TaxID=2874699 RepID=A0A964BPA6_9CYAN|nr:phosphonate C-P lyase system protein PhnH [Waterburya agarophytonicola]MCC0177093.1 phosphonate C-P lyase system protein PhnH [Waterburya agarophytonicola KI4]
MIVELPGFEDLIHDSQSTFKVLLYALSRPGTINQITAQLTPPRGLNIACAATCLTLFDLETKVWLQPGLGEEIKSWLLFHTGCSFTEDTQQTDFAVIWDIDNMPGFSQFKQGTPIYPEDSTTLLIMIGGQVFSPLSDKFPTLSGAGINGQITMPINLPDSFWQQWQKKYDSYPLGVDVYFLFYNGVIGLPRTSKII